MRQANRRARWEPILAIAGACLLLVGAYFIQRAALPKVDTVLVGNNCHTPVTIFQPPPGVNLLATAIFVHGLSANRRTMEYLGVDFAAHGFKTYLLDLPGHGDSLDKFTFAGAQRCAEAAVDSLVANKQIDPRKTILLGHSMGGAIVIRMADHEPVAATIAISPAPMVTPTRMPGNLLVLSGQYDPGVLKRQAEALASAAGGTRIAQDDFSEQRAFKLERVAHATHTSPLIDHDVAHQTEEWAMQALFPSITPKTLALNLALVTYDNFNRGRRRLAGAIMGFVGLLLLFPFCATLATNFALPTASESPQAHPSRGLALAETAVCGLASVLLLVVNVPLGFLHLYAGDYLASLLLLSGAMLLILNWKDAKRNLGIRASAVLGATALGFWVILTIGAWLNWQIADLWLNAPRWGRFLGLLPVTWIFCFAEQVVLGPPGGGRRRVGRFATFLAMRGELWLACALGYYALSSSEALLAILVVSFAVFSALQGLATDVIRGRTGSAAAAAVLGAILAAWFIAAVFPLN